MHNLGPGCELAVIEEMVLHCLIFRAYFLKTVTILTLYEQMVLRVLLTDCETL